MSLFTTILTYAAAWFILSVFVGLGVGRMFRLMAPVYEIDTPEVLESVTWDSFEYQTQAADRLEIA